ncbi:hypothetical protein J2X90_005702 [Variovorax paradoxus]|uniref:DUF6988 family protein n=1 Tax=Variovorax paradoxus TaxID=34073 RepID=UPI00278B7D84|nr:hypothetical protein [Variovorax paradoxus]MDQ0027866.1 hypothetical protein [Variovorax paradoxus]
MNRKVSTRLNIAADEDCLGALLEASEVLDGDIAALLGRCRPRAKRGAIALALCSAAFEHGVSQRVLLQADLNGSALVLCRPHFEAVVRAAWTGQGASDQWIEAFTTPAATADGAHKEPILGPPIASMLETFGRHAPHVASEFTKLAATIPAMNSLVHGGSQIVAYALKGGYPTEKLAAVLLNRNLLHWYTANCAVVSAQEQHLVPRMRLLIEKHGKCMPSSASSHVS